jgi:TRAP-type C4-dicarboxylate transport system substrate-binding protein
MDTGEKAGIYNNTIAEKVSQETIEKCKAAGVEIITIDMAEFQAKAKGFYAMPGINSGWSPNYSKRSRERKR